MLIFNIKHPLPFTLRHIEAHVLHKSLGIDDTRHEVWIILLRNPRIRKEKGQNIVSRHQLQLCSRNHGIMIGKEGPQALAGTLVPIDELIYDQLLLHYFIQHITFRVTLLRIKHTGMCIVIKHTFLPPGLTALESTVIPHGELVVQLPEYCKIRGIALHAALNLRLVRELPYWKSVLLIFTVDLPAEFTVKRNQERMQKDNV